MPPATKDIGEVSLGKRVEINDIVIRDGQAQYREIKINDLNDEGKN